MQSEQNTATSPAGDEDTGDVWVQNTAENNANNHETSDDVDGSLIGATANEPGSPVRDFPPGGPPTYIETVMNGISPGAASPFNRNSLNGISSPLNKNSPGGPPIYNLYNADFHVTVQPSPNHHNTAERLIDIPSSTQEAQGFGSVQLNQNALRGPAVKNTFDLPIVRRSFTAPSMTSPSLSRYSQQGDTEEEEEEEVRCEVKSTSDLKELKKCLPS